VIRNSLVDCEYRDNPVPISQISISGGVATVTTRLPHGRANGNYVVISGALVDGSPKNTYNGSYPISNAAGSSFTYTPVSYSGLPVPTTNPVGERWVDRFPSHFVAASKLEQLGTDPGDIATLTTLTPHNRKPSNNVLVGNAGVTPGTDNFYNGGFPITQIVSPVELKYRMSGVPTDQHPTGNIVMGPSFQALSNDAGTAAVVESNRIFNCLTGGPYHDTFNTKDLIIRRNHYRGVNSGPYQQMGFLNAAKAGKTLTNNGAIAIFETYLPHGFSVGQAVQIAGASDPLFNGTFPVWSVPNPTQFTYQMTSTPSPNTSTSFTFRTLWQTGRLVIENNIIELIPNIHPNGYGRPLGIELFAPDFGLVYVFRQVVIRNNVIRRVDDGPDSSQWPVAIRLFNCENAIVEDNVIGLTTSNPIRRYYCKSIKFLNNQGPDGTLVQGGEFNISAPEVLVRRDTELQINLEDATLLSL
jgi:hypothetical protein